MAEAQKYATLMLPGLTLNALNWLKKFPAKMKANHPFLPWKKGKALKQLPEDALKKKVVGRRGQKNCALKRKALMNAQLPTQLKKLGKKPTNSNRYYVGFMENYDHFRPSGGCWIFRQENWNFGWKGEEGKRGKIFVCGERIFNNRDDKAYKWHIENNQ